MDPLTITALASGVGGGLLGLFGKKKKKTYTMQDLIRAGYKPTNVSEEVTDLNRSVENRLKSIRAASNEKGAQYGLDPVSSNFANEEGIHNAAIEGESAIKKQAKEEEQRMAQMLFQMNAMQPDEQSDLESFFSGAVGGLDIGLQAYDILKPVAGLPADVPNAPGTPKSAPMTSGTLPPPETLANNSLINTDFTMGEKKKKKGLGKYNFIDESLFDENFMSEDYGKQLDLNFRKKKITLPTF